jgi:2-aminoethylphosphonate-pyruvate transaminase
MILLNPGPTNTRFMTKLHQWIGSDKCHRENDFKEILISLQEKLLSKVFLGKAGRIAIMGGSGTTAMEAMISSLVPDGVSIINAGSYGERAISILETFKIKHKIICSKTIDDLSYNENIKFVYFVENETSTCEHYSLKNMCQIYPNAKFFIDATSSFGASDYCADYLDRIAALSFCSNKCLQSTPGLGIVIWNGETNTYKRSFYGDLDKYGTGKLPFTLPVQSVHALEYTVSKNSSNKEAFDARRDRLIKALSSFGIVCLNKYPANSIIAFRHPNKAYDQLHSFLKNKGIIIYSGTGRVDNSFRISTMSIKFDKSFNKIIGALHDSCLS